MALQQYTQATDRDMFFKVIDTISQLVMIQNAYVASEMLSYLGMRNFIVKHIFFMRMLHVITQSLFLISLLKTTLHLPVSRRMIQVVVIIVLACNVCVLHVK